MKIKRIEKVEVSGPHSLRLEFNNGLRKAVNVLPLLRGPVFEPLLDPVYFGRVLLIQWPGLWSGQTARTSLRKPYMTYQRRMRRRRDRLTSGCSGRAARRPAAEPQTVSAPAPSRPSPAKS